MPIVPWARYEPVDSHSGPVAAHLGLVVHVQVGSGDCFGEFSNPNNQASSTWWIAQSGALVQYLDSNLTAWTEAAGNPDYCSVETEGEPTEPLTTAQAGALALLIAWGHKVHGWPLVLVDHGGEGITTHAHYPSGDPDPAWGGHPCPGPIRSAQLPGIVTAAEGLVRAQAQTPAGTEAQNLPPLRRRKQLLIKNDTAIFLVSLDLQRGHHIADEATGTAYAQALGQTVIPRDDELISKLTII